MKKINNKAMIISIITFAIMIIAYEKYVSLWAENELGAIIRADIIMIYPLIVAVSVGLYFFIKKLGKK